MDGPWVIVHNIYYGIRMCPLLCLYPKPLCTIWELFQLKVVLRVIDRAVSVDKSVILAVSPLFHPSPLSTGPQVIKLTFSRDDVISGLLMTHNDMVKLIMSSQFDKISLWCTAVGITAVTCSHSMTCTLSVCRSPEPSISLYVHPNRDLFITGLYSMCDVRALWLMYLGGRDLKHCYMCIITECNIISRCNSPGIKIKYRPPHWPNSLHIWLLTKRPWARFSFGIQSL